MYKCGKIPFEILVRGYPWTVKHKRIPMLPASERVYDAWRFPKRPELSKIAMILLLITW